MRDVPPLPDDPGRHPPRLLDGAAAAAGRTASGPLTSAELVEQIGSTLGALADLPGAVPAGPTDPEAGYELHLVELTGGGAEVVRGSRLEVEHGALVLRGYHGRKLRVWPSSRWVAAGRCDEHGESAAVVHRRPPSGRKRRARADDADD